MKQHLYVAGLILFTFACKGPREEEKTNPVAKLPEQQPKVTFKAPQERHSPIKKEKRSVDYTYLKKNNDDRFTLRDFYQAIALSPQYFTIDPSKDTILTGEKGTLIHIPAHSFQTRGRQLYSGNEITFLLKECYNYPDMVKEHLSTMNNDVALESAGMIYTAALAGKDTLELRKNHEIGIAFTNVKTNTEFDLYYGQRTEDGNINWQLDANGCAETPVFNLAGGKYKNIYDDFFIDVFRLPKEDMIALQGKPLNIKVSFTDLGEIIGYTFEDHRSPQRKAACAEFISVMKNYKSYDPTMNFDGWGADFTFTSCGRNELLNREMNDITSIAVRNNMYFSQNLGWANCDRIPVLRPAVNAINFVRGKIRDKKERQKMEMTHNVVVETGDDIAADVKILYKGMRSIITPTIYGGTYVFKKLPEGQEAYVLATRCHDGKIFFSKQKLTVSAHEKPIRVHFKSYDHTYQVKKEIEDLVLLQN